MIEAGYLAGFVCIYLTTVTLLLYFLTRWSQNMLNLHKNKNHRDKFSHKSVTVVYSVFCGRLEYPRPMGYLIITGL